MKFLGILKTINIVISRKSQYFAVMNGKILKIRIFSSIAMSYGVCISYPGDSFSQLFLSVKCVHYFCQWSPTKNGMRPKRLILGFSPCTSPSFISFILTRSTWRYIANISIIMHHSMHPSSSIDGVAPFLGCGWHRHWLHGGNWCR